MWFYDKKRKIGKGNLHLTENRFGRNKIWYAEGNNSYMCHMCARGFLGLNCKVCVNQEILKNRECCNF